MREQSHIDDYVKAKLSERRHAFQPEHWEMAEALILDQERQKRRRFLIWLWLGLGSLPILLMAGLGLWAPFDNSNQRQEQNHLAVVHTDSLEDNCQESGQLATVTSAPTEKVDLSHKASKANQAGFFESTNTNTNTNTTKRGPSGVAKSLAVNRIDAQQGENPTKWKDQLPSYGELGEGERTLSFSDIYKLRKRSFEIPLLLHFSPDSPGQFLDPFSHQKHSLGIEWGVQLNQAFGTNTVDLSAHPSLGIRYSYLLRPGMRLVSGMRYTGRSGLNSDSTFRARDFGFGFEENQLVRSPRVAHLLEIPLGIEMRVWKRHYIQLGGQTHFLMDVSGREISRENTDFEEVPISEERVFGLRQGFRRVNAGLFAGYGYYLGQGTLLHVQLAYHFRDMTSNSFFQQNRIDRPWAVRISLSHDLRRK